MIPNNLDLKTLDLLKSLKNEFEISFEQKDINYCEATINKKFKTAKIYYNPKNTNTESIAHELLHVWISTFDYSIGNYIYLYLTNNDKLNKIFDKDFCDYIGNCCEHNKIYPKYLEMGYSPEMFLVDGLELKASLENVKDIKLQVLHCYWAQEIRHFIGHPISILADHINENEYSEHHKLLKEKNIELYNLVLSFWHEWVVLELENVDSVLDSVLEISNSFIYELRDWVKNKIVI